MEQLNMKDLVYKDKEGNIIKNAEEYFNALQQDILVEEKLEIGDIVRVKNSPNKIEIYYLNFEVPNIGVFDYAGKDLDEDSNNDLLTLFNQKDIASYEKGKNHGKGKW